MYTTRSAQGTGHRILGRARQKEENEWMWVFIQSQHVDCSTHAARSKVKYARNMHMEGSTLPEGDAPDKSLDGGYAGFPPTSREKRLSWLTALIADVDLIGNNNRRQPRSMPQYQLFRGHEYPPLQTGWSHPPRQSVNDSGAASSPHTARIP